VIVRYVDIGGIDDHYCLNCSFIMTYNCRETDNKTNDNDVENQVPGLDMYNTVVMFFYSQEDIT
jgi:hypothetical protein